MKTTLTIEQSAELIKRGVSADKASEIFIDAGEHGMFSTPKATSMMLECAREAKVISPIFTLTDLLSLLPEKIKVDSPNADGSFDTEDCYLCMQWCTDRDCADNYQWCIYYTSGFQAVGDSYAKELIDALYKCLIWAIEHGHVKLD